MQRRNRFKRIRVKIAVVTLVVVVLDQLFVWAGRRISIGHDTTYITAPISSGYPDYLEYLNERAGDGVTVDNNAATRVLEALGTGRATASWRTAVLNRLHVEEIEPSFLPFEE